jgi:hypothetical protein
MPGRGEDAPGGSTRTGAASSVPAVSARSRRPYRQARSSRALDAGWLGFVGAATRIRRTRQRLPLAHGNMAGA